MSLKAAKYRKKVTKAVGEVLLITLGILGAFAIEDWQERKKQDKLLKDTLNITMVELSHNYCALIKSHQHQSASRDKLKNLPEAKTQKEQEALYLSVYEKGILQPAQLTTTAWDTAVSTGAVRNIPLKDATLIAQFYNDAKSYNNRVDIIVTEMIKNDYKEIELIYTLAGAYGSIDSLWWFEKRQINRYEKNFASLAKQYNFTPKDCAN